MCAHMDFLIVLFLCHHWPVVFNWCGHKPKMGGRFVLIQLQTTGENYAKCKQSKATIAI